MLIQITNTCHMGCPHCMDRATPDPQHMPWPLVERSVAWAQSLGVRTMLISGGEPTCHPEWKRIFDYCAERFVFVIVPTNGAWLETPIEEDIVDLLRKHTNLRFQISSFPGLYREHTRITSAAPCFFRRLKEVGLKHRVTLETDRALIDSKMLALGRACDDPALVHLAETAARTTSCFSSAIVAAQRPLREALAIMESRGKFCHPLVDWRGSLHWAESWLCPAFAHVTEDDATIAEKAHTWRPCGLCAGYRKLLANNEPKYLLAKLILGGRYEEAGRHVG